LIVADDPVKFDLFVMVESAIIAGGMALAGILYRRQDKQDARIAAVDDKVQLLSDRAANRHDTALSDVWQALDDHRTESRRQASDEEKHSREFRETTLRQLGHIEATLARLETRLPPPPLLPHHPGA
jgi:hypothetical protein